MLIKTFNQLVGIARSCKITAQLHIELGNRIKPGVKAIELEKFAQDFIAKNHGRPAFMGVPGGYGAKPFPAALCISFNEEIVHGIPGNRVIQEGDLVKIDTGVIYNGLYSDAAVTYKVPPVSPEGEHLCQGTMAALEAGIRAMRVGNRVSDISASIGDTLNQYKLKIIRELTGHGVGIKLHEEPVIPNYGIPGKGKKIENGAVFALEPMASLGSCDIILGSNRWVYITADGSLASHYEHTVAVWDNQTWVLTKPDCEFLEIYKA